MARFSDHPPQPGKSLAIGIFAAPVLIPLLPIILPLIALYYFGVIIRIAFAGEGRK